MREALSGIDCWVSGIRREDSETRAGAAKFGWDRRFGLWKLNPLADWTEAEVWDYINEHESFPTTHFTTPAIPRSGARTARARRAPAAIPARVAGRMPTRPSAACTAEAGRAPARSRTNR